MTFILTHIALTGVVVDSSPSPCDYLPIAFHRMPVFESLCVVTSNIFARGWLSRLAFDKAFGHCRASGLSSESLVCPTRRVGGSAKIEVQAPGSLPAAAHCGSLHRDARGHDANQRSTSRDALAQTPFGVFEGCLGRFITDVHVWNHYIKSHGVRDLDQSEGCVQESVLIG